MINIDNINIGDCVSFIRRVGIYSIEDGNHPENIVGTVEIIDRKDKVIQITIMNDRCFQVNDIYTFSGNDFKFIKKISIKRRDKILAEHPRKY